MEREIAVVERLKYRYALALCAGARQGIFSLSPCPHWPPFGVVNVVLRACKSASSVAYHEVAGEISRRLPDKANYKENPRWVIMLRRLTI